MIKPAVDITIRYVIPGLAAATGLGAWLLSANGPGVVDESTTALLPDSEYPPITRVIEVPELPSLFNENSNLEVLGSAYCDQDSTRSARGLGCDVGGELLDPCYWPPGDVGIPYVFCFNPEIYSYELYEVASLTDDATLWESIPVEYLIYVEYPEQNNLADYPKELVDTATGTYDVCRIDDYNVENPIDRTYTCLTGSKVSGGVLGDKPHYFVEYIDAKTNSVSSQWLGFIIYG